VGWISRKNLASGRGGSFFLTSLFIELIDAGVESAHGLLETNFGRTLRFRSHLFLLSHLDSYEGHISRSGTRNNWFDRRGRRRDLCFAFTCLLGPGDNRRLQQLLPVCPSFGQKTKHHCLFRRKRLSKNFNVLRHASVSGVHHNMFAIPRMIFARDYFLPSRQSQSRNVL